VTEGVDALGAPAAKTTSSAVTAGVPFSFDIEELNPASSYILLISAKNSD
jgi:hypothetical protein